MPSLIQPFSQGKQQPALSTNHRNSCISVRAETGATRLLKALANSIVNGPPGSSESYARPSPFFAPVPPLATDRQYTDSPAMAVFRDQGAEGLSKWLRASKELQLTDTTFRDAHQSLLATRVRTRDLLAVAPTTARLCSNLFSLEMWGEEPLLMSLTDS